MQKHAFERRRSAGAHQRFIQIEIAIFIISSDRKTLAGQVHPDLVGTPCTNGNLQQSETGGLFAYLDQGQSGDGVGVVLRGYPDPALAVGQQVLM